MVLQRSVFVPKNLAEIGINPPFLPISMIIYQSFNKKVSHLEICLHQNIRGSQIPPIFPYGRGEESGTIYILHLRPLAHARLRWIYLPQSAMTQYRKFHVLQASLPLCPIGRTKTRRGKRMRRPGIKWDKMRYKIS